MYILAQNIDKAPDATAFLSTVTLLVGILVTVAGTGLVQLFLSVDEESRPGPFLDSLVAQRFFILGLTALVDLWGVGFPLFALYKNSVGSVTENLIVLVFISTIAVFIANLILPIYVASLIKAAREWQRWLELGNVHSGTQLIEKARELVSAAGHLSEAEFDGAIKQAENGTLSAAATQKFLKALLKSFIFGKRRRRSPYLQTNFYTRSLSLAFLFSSRRYVYTWNLPFVFLFSLKVARDPEWQIKFMRTIRNFNREPPLGQASERA